MPLLHSHAPCQKSIKLTIRNIVFLESNDFWCCACIDDDWRQRAQTSKAILRSVVLAFEHIQFYSFFLQFILGCVYTPTKRTLLFCGFHLVLSCNVYYLLHFCLPLCDVPFSWRVQFTCTNDSLHTCAHFKHSISQDTFYTVCVAGKAWASLSFTMRRNYLLYKQHVENPDGEWVLTIACVIEILFLRLIVSSWR